jgi:hypothetical protein
MADARHGRPEQAHQAAQPPQPWPDASGEWQVVARRKRWRRLARQAPPPSPRRPVPADLVGLCFSCLRPGHVAAACSNVTRCLCCHRKGHQARACKRPDHRMRRVHRRVSSGCPRWSSSTLAAATLPWATRPLSGAALAQPRPAATQNGSPSRHTLPSPPTAPRATVGLRATPPL